MDDLLKETDASGLLRYVQCRECGKALTSIRTTHFKNKCSGVLTSLQEYKEKYPAADTMSPSSRAAQGNSLANSIKKYGEELGRIKWAAYCKKLSDKNTLESFLQRGKTKEDFDRYNASRAVTLENMVKKYGRAEGTARFEAYRHKQKHAGCSLEYFQSKHGNDQGLQIYQELNKRKAVTLENLKTRYSDEEAMAIYYKWLAANRYSSLLCEEFIDGLVARLHETIPGFKFHSAVHGGEFCIYQDRPYLYDFVITCPAQICIEFHGDFWHANPKKYHKNDMIPRRGSEPVPALKLWEQDAHKEKLITSRGYLYKAVWESDYLANKEQAIEECTKWILLNSK